MSLANKLNRFIYMHGAEDIIQIGARIFNDGRVSFVSEDKNHHTVVFKTKDDVYDLYRTVTIRNYYDMQAIKLDCTCTHQRRNLCKHTIAALFFLKKMIGGKEIDVPKVSYDQSRTVLKMSYINSKYLQNSVSPQLFKDAEDIVRVFRAKIERGDLGEVRTQVKSDGELYPVTIKFNQENKEFITSCSCNDSQFIVCKHKLSVFLQISRFYGTRYFSTIYNNLNDAKLKNKISQSVDVEENPLPPLVKKSSLKGIALSQDAINQLKAQLQNVSTSSVIDQVIFRENINTYPHYSIFVTIKKEKYEVQPLAQSPMLNKVLRTVKDKELVNILLKLTSFELSVHLAGKRHLFHGMFSKDTQYRSFEAIPEEMRMICFEYLQTKFRQLHNIPQLKQISYWQKAGSDDLSARNKLHFADELLEPVFFIDLKDEDWIQIRIQMKINNEWVDMEDNELMSPHAFIYNSVLYAWRENHYDIFTKVKRITDKKISFRNWGSIARKELSVLFQHYDFHIDERLAVVQEVEFDRTELFVRETDQFLHFQLFFHYGELRIPYDGHQYIYQQSKDRSLTLLRRNRIKELAVYQKIFAMHQRMVNSNDSDLYPFEMILSKEDALQKQWFLSFSDAMKKEDIILTGLEQLKKFSAKEVKPSMRIDINSEIDWLNIKIDVRVENELLNMRSLLPILEGKTTLVTLKNGRVVLVSKSWVKQWKLLFKLAEERDGMNFRFKLNQVSLINAIISNGVAEVNGQIQDEYLFINWSKESRKLLGKPMNRNLQLPSSLCATLKNYQKESFYWFQHLKKNEYSGLLGDDMGLGKTLQVLTNLLYEKERNKKINALIICPATLICTWQEEVHKFTPSLRTMVYHSTQRVMDVELFRSKDLIITTYGVIRSDVALFKNYQFDYVILDESQMIKNPNSNTYQAVMALNSKHRICLSGTPLQNNTFDLYAQINFLNPNFLGPMTFFRDHFSIPIDRHGDKDVQKVLKNAISPLFLRRTKEEVSPELPDKNVNILYCEMEDEQRRIYENCKAGFSSLLDKVRADGIQYYKMHVLQALTKLRMICNAPSLLNKGTDKSMPEISIKKTLLLERIKDNVFSHKVIVFSQFLGMLDLLRKGLEQHKISFEYLDGSTTVKDRERSVRKFREGDEVRVFLVSLKAGGVGLNLTAADYVYIVDPWWNPTVEMQAIDRTHRIGQTKKVFAHRMICKNSIEEQIISLQEKKFKLSKALIDKTDDAFLRNITVEELAYLLQ